MGLHTKRSIVVYEFLVVRAPLLSTRAIIRLIALWSMNPCVKAIASIDNGFFVTLYCKTPFCYAKLLRSMRQFPLISIAQYRVQEIIAYD